MFSNNNSDDTEMLRQMRLLYCRSNQFFRMFNKCSKNVLIELCRSFCTTFYCPYYWTAYKNVFVLHTIMYIASCWVFVAVVVLVKCL